jgi:hypothetical protein
MRSRRKIRCDNSKLADMWTPIATPNAKPTRQSALSRPDVAYSEDIDGNEGRTHSHHPSNLLLSSQLCPTQHSTLPKP